MTRQKYESYWKITLAYTNIYGEKFKESLNIILKFIDENYINPYSKQKYDKLQKALNDVFPINDASIRKVINSYIKLGFVNPRLESYHKDSQAFLRAPDEKKMKTIFSKIVYSNSGFDKTTTRLSKKREINFLIKTLEEVKKLDKPDVLALMTKDIARIKKGYLTRKEIDEAKKYTNQIKLAERKYNQRNHFWSMLHKLDNLVINKGILYLEEDVSVADLQRELVGKKRDPYLQIIFKNELKEECMQIYGRIQCVLEKIDYPPISFIASHIKPFVNTSSEEAYDVNNGLLLSKNMDSLFDQGYISFKDTGEIILSKRLTIDVKKTLFDYSLDSRLMTEKRKKYFEYHRKEVFV